MKRKIKEIWEKTVGLVTALAVLAFFVLIIVCCVVCIMRLVQSVRFRPADDLLPADTPSEGVAWIMPEAGEVPVWLSPVCAGEAETAVWLDHYTEGDGPAPEWWRPDEPMSAEWEDHSGEANKMVDDDHYIESDKMVGDFAGDINVPCKSEPHPPIGIDPGGVDWNLCSTVWGWDGHGAEAWELDLLARVFYLEFWQPDMMLCEAGCDAILRLWENGEKGRTLGEVLSSRNEDGSWTYSVYPDIWTTDYDEDGLAWCWDYTAERFAEGPVWIAPYFRLDYYHDWAVPAYQIGNVYFSVGG